MAGIGITISDDRIVTPEMVSGNLFLTPSDIGKTVAIAALSRVQELNPHVTVKSFPEPSDDTNFSDILTKGNVTIVRDEIWRR